MNKFLLLFNKLLLHSFLLFLLRSSLAVMLMIIYPISKNQSFKFNQPGIEFLKTTEVCGKGISMLDLSKSSMIDL